MQGMSGNIVTTSEIYEGSFSGQLSDMSGTIDLLLKNSTYSTSATGSSQGEDMLDLEAYVDVFGDHMAGSVEPYHGDEYFLFEASRR
jgi:hypothetical protein